MTGRRRDQTLAGGAENGEISPEWFAGQVRDALLHLHDPAYLETHPLTRLLPGGSDARRVPLSRILRQALLAAIDVLRPVASPRSLARHSQIIELRYVDALSVREICDRLAISRTEFYREHQRAVDAVASSLQSQWHSTSPRAEQPGGASPFATSPGEGSDASRSTARRLSPSGGLPLPLTSLIGREAELADLKRLLEATRLLTLTGAGGCGKTRLALQVASETRDEYPDGVWLAQLAAQTDPALVPETVAATLGLREEPGKPIATMLAEYLRPQRILLVLDSCEHLLQACGALVETLLSSCPSLGVLVTSREALGVPGEVSWRVPSLAAPRPDEGLQSDQLSQYGAIRLFVERARAVRPEFAITRENAPNVGQICWRLDGMPLAIELAAARVRILAVEQIAARLDDRFRLLTGGARTALPRQQTLRAAIDWSYDPLADAERRVFRRLSVFAGGCDLDAAEAVCPGDGVEPGDVLDILAALGDKSLIVVAEEHGQARYQMLETIRQYARDRLLESGEAEATRERHRAWFASLARHASVELGGAGQKAWLDQLETDHDNLRSALEWCVGREPDEGLILGSSLWLFWRVRGYLAEGRRWLEALLANAPGPSTARAEALLGLGIITADLGNYALAQARCASSLADFRQLGDRRGAGRALRHLGATWLFLREQTKAEPLLKESLATLEHDGGERDVAWTLRYLGDSRLAKGELESGRGMLERSLTLLRRAGDKHALSWVLQDLATAGVRAGRLDAEALAQEAADVAREIGDRRAIGSALGHLAMLALGRGDRPSAARLAEESRSLCWETGYAQGVTWALNIQAYLARAEGDAARARVILRECLGAMEPGRIAVTGEDTLALTGLLAIDRGDFSPGVRLIASSSGTGASLLPRTRFGAAQAGEFALALESARAALGDEAFDRAWADGQGLKLEQAVEYALGILVA